MELQSKIIYGLERISDSFKTVLWEKSKEFGISPFQIQLLIFIANHKIELCNVTHLAQEFNVTKPTVSDAIRVLISKSFLTKDYSNTDNRSYNLFVTEKGKSLISTVSAYTLPLEKALRTTNEKQLENLYSAITHLIDSLNKSGIIQVQRSCYSCQFHKMKNKNHFCELLNKALMKTDIQLDCPEHKLS